MAIIRCFTRKREEISNNYNEGDSKVILQRIQSPLEYALAGIARTKTGLLGHPHYSYYM